MQLDDLRASSSVLFAAAERGPSRIASCAPARLAAGDLARR